MGEKPRFYVETFGRDCLGNNTGWRVYDREKDGTVAAQFVGNIYEPGSHDKARGDAYQTADKMNRIDIRKTLYL